LQIIVQETDDRAAAEIEERLLAESESKTKRGMKVNVRVHGVRTSKLNATAQTEKAEERANRPEGARRKES
jgi:hypothetical protein